MKAVVKEKGPPVSEHSGFQALLCSSTAWHAGGQALRHGHCSATTWQRPSPESSRLQTGSGGIDP